VTRVMLVITRLVCRKFRVETKAPKAQPWPWCLSVQPWP